jgi:acylphosphatase
VNTALSSLHATIEGHVQGVGFRNFVLTTAINLDLTGWVRNTPDGDVEVLAEGPRPVLELLLEALHHGPRSAFVTAVRSEWQTPTGEFEQFSVRPTSRWL